MNSVEERNTSGNVASILILCKWPLNQLPPIISVAQLISTLGQPVKIVCLSCPATLRASLWSTGISVVTVEDSDPGFGIGRWTRFLQWWRFHLVAHHMLKSVSHSIVWIGSGDTALALGHNALRGLRFVLHLHELYDNKWMYRVLLKGFAREAACVVVPEASRAAILRSWFSLIRTPMVLPNKPASHPKARGMPLDKFVSAHIDQELRRRDIKYILYQGHIGHNRDLSGLARAIAKLGAPWQLVLMGYDHDGYVAELRRLCPNLLHIGHIDPPNHLNVTSWAYAGAVSYSYDLLNNVFCAPNKIWEYTGFGIPVIGNELPGLVNTIAASGAGLCVDWGDPDKVVQSLLAIEEKYDQFGTHASHFFESCNPQQIVEGILNASMIKTDSSSLKQTQ